MPVKVPDGEVVKAWEKKGYDRVAATYGVNDAEGADEGRQQLLTSVEVSFGDSVLDVCCGPGWLTIEASRIVGPEGTAIGVDLSTGMHTQATANARESGSTARFQVMDAEKLEFSDSSFDAVVCSYGLMHIPDPGLAVSEMARVLRPGGRLALRVWASPERSVFLGLLAQSLRHAAGDSLPIDYGYTTRLGAPGVLESLLADARLSDVKVQTVEDTISTPSAEEFWEGFQGGAGIFAILVEGLNEDQRTTAVAEFQRLSEVYRRGDELVLPADYLLATARR